MNLFISGGSGFIGLNFINLADGRYNITVLGRERNCTSLRVNGHDYPYLSTDYSVGSLIKVLRGADAVLHLAAQKVDRAENRLEPYLDANALLARNLFEACKERGITNIVHLSSRLVYSEADPLPWDETRDPHPTTPYGISKLLSEKIAHYYNHHHALKIKSLRIAQVLGEGAKNEREFLVTKYIIQAVQKKKLTVYGEGEGKREYLYVKDLAYAVECALQNGARSGVYNIGAKTNISYKELARLVNLVYENEGGIVFLKNKPEDRSIGRMDSTKAWQELGYVPRWSLKEALEDLKMLFISKYGRAH